MGPPGDGLGRGIYFFCLKYEIVPKGSCPFWITLTRFQHAVKTRTKVYSKNVSAYKRRALAILCYEVGDNVAVGSTARYERVLEMCVCHKIPISGFSKFQIATEL